VPPKMKKLVRDANRKHADAIEHAAEVHARFEQIHPFSDGNGRIGRLLIHAMLLRKNIPPAVIVQEHRHRYYQSLQRAQQRGDFGPLKDLLCDAVMRGFRILERKA